MIKPLDSLKRLTSVLILLLLSPTAMSEGQAPTLTERLASEQRDAADRARDAGRKPVEVLDFLGIGPGMSVMDMIAAGGYYTEVLSLAVGETGSVIAQNPARVLQFRGGANEKALSKRLAEDRLPNVTRMDLEVTELKVAPGSLDAVVTALNFHDIYNGAGLEAAEGAAHLIHALLKPGGVFGVIDHAGDAGKNNAALHRMEQAQAESVLRSAGFEVEVSGLLSNPDDARDKGVFDPSIRGKTDRFLIRASKPAE